MTDAGYEDDPVLLTNTPAQAESFLHSLVQEAGGISLCLNANITESMCFKQERTISNLSGKPLK